MAAAGGDFTVLSAAVAARDASLPVEDLLDQLRSPRPWRPEKPRPLHNVLSLGVVTEHRLAGPTQRGRSASNMFV